MGDQQQHHVFKIAVHGKQFCHYFQIDASTPPALR
jgi:hypothetical protein